MKINDLAPLSKIADVTTKIIPLIRTPLAIASFALILLMASLILILLGPIKDNTVLYSISLFLCLVTFSAVALSALRIHSKAKTNGVLQIYKPGEFDVPAQLAIFSQGKVQKDGKYLITVRDVISIRSLGGGRLKVHFPMFSQGEIKEAISLSDPDRMHIHGIGSSEGAGVIEIVDSEKYSHYLVVIESLRKVQIGSFRQPPHPNDTVLHSLFDNIIKTNLHAFVGAKIIANTAYVRLVIQFDRKYKPSRLHPVEVTSDGRIISPDAVIADMPERSLYIADLTSPKPGAGFYVWWKWDKFPENIIEMPALKQ